jgi:putative membrane protein
MAGSLIALNNLPRLGCTFADKRKIMSRRALLLGIAVVLHSALSPGQGVYQAKLNLSGGEAKISDKSVIQRCTGTTDASVVRNHALIYNPEANALEIVDARTGAKVCDVLTFSGGTTPGYTGGNERVTFVYLPGQEQAIGSAVLIDRSTGGNTDRLRLSARLEIALPTGTLLGGDFGDGNNTRSMTGTFTAGRLIQAGEEADPTPTQSDTALNSQDTDFLQDAAQLNVAEIVLGSLMVERGQSIDVRGYGLLLVKDHTLALQQLTNLAALKGVTLPLTLTSSDSRTLERLALTPYQRFDSVARTRAISVHGKAINRHQAEVRRGEDSDVVGFANAQLPALQTHLELARGLPNTVFVSNNIEENSNTGVLGSRNTGIGLNNTSIGTFTTGSPLDNLFGQGSSTFGFGSTGTTNIGAAPTSEGSYQGASTLNRLRV